MTELSAIQKDGRSYIISGGSLDVSVVQAEAAKRYKEPSDVEQFVAYVTSSKMKKTVERLRRANQKGFQADVDRIWKKSKGY